MIYEHAHLRIAESDHAAFEAAAPRVKEILLAAPGSQSVTIVKSVDEANLYLLLVGWDHIDSHLVTFPTTPQGAELADLIGGFFAEAPAVTHFSSEDLTE